MLVKAAGSKGEVPLCAAAIVPPEVGFVQAAHFDKPLSVATYIIVAVAITLLTKLFPRPFAVVLLVKVTPPSVEIPNPATVAAYTVLPDANTLMVMLLPRPFDVVLFVKFDPPSEDILTPPLVAA
jgi:hypothetical protein